MDLDGAADELYALLPGEFIDERTRLAAEAKTAGKKELAGQIAKLRRPTVAAWLVNLLVRTRPDQIDDLLELGVAMRAAQEQLSGPDLRALSKQRNEVVTALVRTAAKAAHEAGQSVSEAVRTDAAQTLQAALADPGVAEEVRVGRLAAAAAYSGFGPDILVERTKTPVTPKPARKPKLTLVEDDGPDPAVARALKAAQDEVERALELLTEAQESAEQAQADAAEAATAAEELTSRVEELRAELARLQKQSTAADREKARLERRTDTAVADLRAAERRAKQAKADLDKLT